MRGGDTRAMTDTQLLRPSDRAVTRGFGRDQSQETSWHGTRQPGLVTALTWVVIATAVTVGIVLRAWYLFHQPVNSDEAVVGLMAMQILHGHFSAFYWGQVYGGGEPYLVAVLFGIFGTSVWALKAVSIVLSAVAAVISWRITRRLVSDLALAILAGALVWAAPEAAVWNSTIELGFRGVTMVCGLGLLLVSLRILDSLRSWLEFAALGLLAGIGWWSSPEIVYFAIPAGLVVIGAIIRDPDIGTLRTWAARLALTLIAGVVGALPWLWANINSGFYSLNTSAFATPPQAPGYGGRLVLFFRYGLPMLFNLRTEETQQLVFGRDWSLLVLIALLVIMAAALVLCSGTGTTSAK